MNDKLEMLRLYEEMALLKGDSLALPLPRRLELPAVSAFRRSLLGQVQEVYRSFIESDASMGEFIGEARDFIATLENLPKFDDQSLKVGYMASKHLALKGAIFSVSEPLRMMLADTALKNNIPVRFFTPPHKISYIEFCPPESRASFPLSAYAGGGSNICEGCYLQEKTVDILPAMTREAREMLELDPQKGARILDIGITVSPLQNPAFADVKTPIAIDNVDTFTLFIQDESEMLSDVLQRHFDFYNLRANISDVDTGVKNRELFQQRATDVFGYLAKVLMYLYVDKKSRYTVREATEHQDRLQKVAEKKRPKLEKQLNRLYDRIIIGPKTYTPLADRIASMDVPKGTKRPHFRSGYFGVRWKGTGQAKVPELIKVDEVLVNKAMLNDSDAPARREYEIR